MNRFVSLLSVALLGVFLAAPASAQDPHEAPDDTWISVTGTVESVSADEFVLDLKEGGHYGENLLIVEMDDGDRDADAYKLLPGDTVTVYGIIDDDFFEMRTIEASSVYVRNLDTYFYASAIDEEDTFVTIALPVVSAMVLQGVVTEVNDDEFKLHTGYREITVEVEEMPYNPLDDVGYQKIEVGDRVSVTGEMDYDFLEGRELVAETITTLSS